jgi:hypothetical protein
MAGSNAKGEPEERWFDDGPRAKSEPTRRICHTDVLPSPASTSSCAPDFVAVDLVRHVGRFVAEPCPCQCPSHGAFGHGPSGGTAASEVPLLPFKQTEDLCSAGIVPHDVEHGLVNAT